MNLLSPFVQVVHFNFQLGALSQDRNDRDEQDDGRWKDALTQQGVDRSRLAAFELTQYDQIECFFFQFYFRIREALAGFLANDPLQAFNGPNQIVLDLTVSLPPKRASQISGNPEQQASPEKCPFKAC